MANFHKFYLSRWDNTKYSKPDDGKVFIKPGITRHMDVMKRFDPSVDNYKKDYSDWKIKILFSKKFNTKQEAQEFENYFLYNVFPYNSKYKVWVEDYYGIEDLQKYNDTGITELRLLEKEEVDNLVQFLYNSLSDDEKIHKAIARKKYA